MQMLYNSDSFVVVRFDGETAAHSGYEIVDKLARRDIFIGGAAAETFKHGVEKLAGENPNVDAIDSFIETWTVLAQQPLVLH